MGLFRREPTRRPRVEPGMGKRSRAGAPPAPSSNKVDIDKMLAAARVAPQLEMLEWDDLPTAPAIVQEAAAPAVQDGNDPRAYDSKRRKIRDRYVGTRFPGVATCSSELESVDRVIKAARLYFEEERNDEALELLELAVEECPHEASLWLARLEILFLIRDAEGYAETARDFHREHPLAEDSWAEVCRLGRALAPGEALFGARKGPRDHEHYGPWPHTPNWIQAPWDLTAEITAADFHRAVSRLAPRSAAGGATR
jgi:tetratricopeptide (TPR) repeat protein